MRKIKTLRLKKALTQKDLAKLCGVSAVTINRIENRLITARPSTRRKIAHALGVPPEEIDF